MNDQDQLTYQQLTEKPLYWSWDSVSGWGLSDRPGLPLQFANGKPVVGVSSDKFTGKTYLDPTGWQTQSLSIMPWRSERRLDEGPTLAGKALIEKIARLESDNQKTKQELEQERKKKRLQLDEELWMNATSGIFQPK